MTTKEKELQAQIEALQAQLEEARAGKTKKAKPAPPKGRAARALTEEQYREFITTMRTGFAGMHPADREATVCVMIATTGMRLSDVMALYPESIVRDGDRWRLNIIEDKTDKPRWFTVADGVKMYLENYCLRNGIKKGERIFPVTKRNVQKKIQLTADYLGMENISSHSFRKFFATERYKKSGYDVALVQRLLQHSSTAITQRYIGIEPQRIEEQLQDAESALM